MPVPQSNLLFEHVCVQPSLSELAKREDFPTQPYVPSEFIRKHGATYSGEWSRICYFKWNILS